MPTPGAWLVLAAVTLSQAATTEGSKPTDPQRAAALEQARACATATASGDVPTIIRYTHPTVIEALGGREKMEAILRKGLDQMKAGGVAMEDARVDPPSALQEQGNSLYSVLPLSVTVRLPQGRFRTHSFLLGVSTDQGAHWTFVDGAPGAEKIRQLLPDLPKDLPLPERRAPMPIEDEAAAPGADGKF